MRFIPRLIKLWKLLGLCQLVKVIACFVFGCKVTVQPIGFPSKFLLRPRGSDLFVMEQVFGKKREGFIDFGCGIPNLIIDGGANVGLTAAAYASRFPKSEIIAVEPDKENFELLKENIKVFSNVRPVCAAIWSRRGLLQFSNPNAASWSKRVLESDDGSISAVTIPDLIASTQFKTADVVKLDIEGAEKEVFRNGPLAAC